MSIKLAQASHSEFYSAWGEPGRQIPDELNIVDWRHNPNNPWHHVFRAKSPEVAEIIAKTFEDAVANHAIGYSQNNGASPRETFFDYLKAAGWDAKKVNKLCNTDCSALGGAAIAAALTLTHRDDARTIASLRTMYTGSALSVIKATGAFDIFTDEAHCQMESNLKRGDILLRSGHMACAINTAKTIDVGRFCTTKDCISVNLRPGPSSDSGDPIRTVAGGSILPYVETDDQTGWIKCLVGNATGWLSPKYCYPMEVGVVENGDVNIRAAADAGSKSLGVIHLGENCHLFQDGKVDSRGVIWYHVYYNGITGWSSSKYVRRRFVYD